MAESLTGSALNLFYLNISPPASVAESKWTKWITAEFIPALQESRVTLTSALYREVGFAMIPTPSHPLPYVLLCQTDLANLQHSETFKKAYQHTGAVDYLSEKMDMRMYGQIQDYNPKKLGLNTKPAPNMLSVEMDPEERNDFEEWYRNELLPKLSTLPGYFRSKRYQISGLGDTTASPYLAVHEIEALSKAFVSQKAHEEASTPRMEKHIEASKQRKTERGGGFLRRGWELVYFEGYQTAPIPCDNQVDHKESHESGIIDYLTQLARTLFTITTFGFNYDGVDKFEPVFI